MIQTDAVHSQYAFGHFKFKFLRNTHTDDDNGDDDDGSQEQRVVLNFFTYQPGNEVTMFCVSCLFQRREENVFKLYTGSQGMLGSSQYA